jgi:hypothetical protein
MNEPEGKPTNEWGPRAPLNTIRPHTRAPVLQGDVYRRIRFDGTQPSKPGSDQIICFRRVRVKEKTGRWKIARKALTRYGLMGKAAF